MKQSPKQPDLSIVVPALDEEKRIGKTLDKLAAFLKKDKVLRTKHIEVAVVSAHSTDKTHDIIQSKKGLFEHFRFLRPGPRVGKGRDVQYGMLRAHGRAVIYMDADLATPLRHLPRFYEAFEQGADVVVGTRNLRTHHASLVRRAVANGGNLLFRVAGGVWIEDSQCGFKLFSHRAAQLCFSKMTIQKWGFDMEILAIAQANRLHIQSFRIDDWQDMPDGTFEGSVIKNSLHSLKDLFHIAGNRVKRVYLENNNT